MSSSALTRSVIVRNPNGLHMRPADLLVKTAARFACEIELEREGQCVSCKSILGILTLGATHGSELTVRASGEDASDALNAVADLFDQGFFEADAEVAMPPGS